MRKTAWRPPVGPAHVHSPGRVVNGSLFLDPTRPGETLTRPDPRLPTKCLTRSDLWPDPGTPSPCTMILFMSSKFKLPTANNTKLLISMETVRNISLQVLFCFPRVRKTISSRIKQTSVTSEFNIALTFYQKEVVILIRYYMARTDEKG